MKECSSLDEVRQNIDEIDRQIITLITERSFYVNQAALLKKSEIEVEAPERVRSVLKRVRKIAIEKGLEPDVAETIYKTIIHVFINQEKKNLIEKHDKSNF